MVLLDLPELSRICQSWGIADPELFASFQLFRPFTPAKKSVTAHQPTREEVLRMQQEVKEKVKRLLSNQQAVPKELIILGAQQDRRRS